MAASSHNSLFLFRSIQLSKSLVSLLKALSISSKNISGLTPLFKTIIMILNQLLGPGNKFELDASQAPNFGRVNPI